MGKFRAMSEVAEGLEGAWARLKWIGRILRNIATGAEISKAYRDDAITILWNRIEVIKGYPDRVIPVVWNVLPATIRSWKVTQAIGHLIHRRVCRVQPRGGSRNNYTRFFRNPPQLELLRDLALEMPRGAPMRILVLGCSTGAELYSAVWMIRMARPEQEVQAVGIDIAETWIQAAARGVYSLQAREVSGISETSYERLFTRQGDTLRVQHWLREGVTWCVGDACSPDLAARFGLQDVVLANHFLFNMPAQRAEACLRNLARLVAPNGYLFICGVDLDVRSRTVRELGLIPVTVRFEEIYTADKGLFTSWPLRFWGLEPMDRRRPDWPARYTTVFRLPDGVRRAPARNREGTGLCL